MPRTVVISYSSPRTVVISYFSLKWHIDILYFLKRVVFTSILQYLYRMIFARFKPRTSSFAIWPRPMYYCILAKPYQNSIYDFLSFTSHSDLQFKLFMYFQRHALLCFLFGFTNLQQIKISGNSKSRIHWDCVLFIHTLHKSFLYINGR